MRHVGAAGGQPVSDRDFTLEEYAERLARLRTAMREANVAAMLIDDAEILAYYTGHERSVSSYRACIVPLSSEPLMILRSLDVAPFEEACWFSAHLAYGDAEDAVEAVARGVRLLGLAQAAIGFDSGSHAMSVNTHERLSTALPGAQFVPCPGLPWEQRLRKSPTEISYLRYAAGIADTVMAEIAARAHAGSTERHWSAYAAKRFIELGGTPGHVGPITVGKGWGFLHGRLHDTPLAQGDVLHLELVPRFRGYSARLMRSVVIGRASEQQRQDADRLRQLQDAQLATMRPGARAGDIDAILRDGLLRSGLREHCDNITGYTLGYYSQQPLRSSDFTHVFLPNANWVLEAGMAFHMYTSARGLAFSETMLVTADGAERLTRIERRLFEAADGNIPDVAPKFYPAVSSL